MLTNALLTLLYTYKGSEHLENYSLSLLSWMGRGTSGRSRCCKPEYTAQLPQPLGVSCDELGLPVAYPCLPALNPIQENTDLPYWFVVTLLMVDESCKSEGEDCDGYCHLSHTVTVKAYS